MDPNVEALTKIVFGSKKIVFFGGAGVSTESGIPDFRSRTAREATHERFGYHPEDILSAGFFHERPKVFYQYLQEFLLQPDVAPNPAHQTLAQWEKTGRLKAVVTQNIDGLHQEAGSRATFELHGTLSHYHCVECAAEYPAEIALTQLSAGAPVPKCACKGFLKPNVVLYGEALPEAAFTGAAKAISEADTLIVAGTSLAVHPAASLITLFEGNHLAVVNLTPTPADQAANLIVRRPVAETLLEVNQQLKW